MEPRVLELSDAHAELLRFLPAHVGRGVGAIKRTTCRETLFDVLTRLRREGADVLERLHDLIMILSDDSHSSSWRLLDQHVRDTLSPDPYWEAKVISALRRYSLGL